LPEMKKQDILDSIANFAVTWAALLQDLLTQAKEQTGTDSAMNFITKDLQCVDDCEYNNF